MPGTPVFRERAFRADAVRLFDIDHRLRHGFPATAAKQPVTPIWPASRTVDDCSRQSSRFHMIITVNQKIPDQQDLAAAASGCSLFVPRQNRLRDLTPLIPAAVELRATLSLPHHSPRRPPLPSPEADLRGVIQNGAD